VQRTVAQFVAEDEGWLKRAAFCTCGDLFADIFVITKATVTAPNARPSSTSIPTAGQIFPDGSVLELLRDPDNFAKLVLVHCSGGAVEIAPEISRGDLRYVPISFDPSVARAVRFPTRVAPPEATSQLFADLCALLECHLAQLEPTITALALAIFASWFSPVLQLAPILSITAPAGSPKDRTLQLLALLCRRPLCLAGAKRSDLLRIPVGLQPTFLLDEPDHNLAMQRALQAGAHRGRFVSTSDGVHELFGPKIIVARSLARGTELETSGLRIGLIPVSGQLPLLAAASQDEIAEKFQARFVSHFLRNSGSVRIPRFGINDLAAPIQDLACALGTGLMGEKDLLGKIVSLLKVRDEEIRSDRAAAFDSIVLESILFFIHDGSESHISMARIAEKAGVISKGRGVNEEPSPERVGHAVKRLEIPSGRIDRSRNGVDLRESICRLVHRIAKGHGVRAMPGRVFESCRYCREVNAQIASETRA
jgi:hypothetical protein